MLLFDCYYYKKPMIFAVLHSFVNIFADGRSDIKTILFFVYLLSLGGLYLLLKKKPFKKIEWRYFGFTALVIYLYGLVLQIIYDAINTVPFGKWSLTSGAGEMSYSSIWHIHLLKASVGIFFPRLGGVDSGRSFLGTFPDIIFLIGSILLIILLLESVWYFVSSFKDALKHKNSRQIIFLITGYALASFSLVKTAIDGGIFQPAFIILSIFIILFIFRTKLPKYHYYLSFIVAFILIIIYSFLNYGSDWIYIQSASLILLYNFILYGTEKEIKLPSILLFAIFFMMSWYLAAYYDLGIYQYSNISVSSNDLAYYYDNSNQKVEKLSSVNGQTLNTLAKELNKTINYLPISVPGITCKDNAFKKDCYLTLISKIPLAKNTFISNEFINIQNDDSVINKGSWQTKLKITEASCLPERLMVIDQELTKHGLTNYLYYEN